MRLKEEGAVSTIEEAEVQGLRWALWEDGSDMRVNIVPESMLRC